MGIFSKSSKNVTSTNTNPTRPMRLPSGASSVSSSSEDLSLAAPPLPSPAYEDVPMWSILPSYQLDESTFSKPVEPSSEDLRQQPPTYEVSSGPTSANDGGGGGDYFSQRSNGNMFTRWESTILGNTHKLKKLQAIAPKQANSIQVEIRLTEKPCKIGVRPTVVDASRLEFSQGDSIHGYVKIENTSSQTFSYDVFSVLFEGRIAVNGDEPGKPSIFYKFLNMLDYKASWTPANFVDGGCQQEVIDPVDGSSMMLTNDKTLIPGVTYKKFFDFTLPEKLLEVACEPHDLPCHCELLPSIGLDKEQFLQQLRKLREKSSSPHPTKASFGMPVPSEYSSSPRKTSASGPARASSPASLRIKDFSFSDTSISYCVEARIIGRLSNFDQEAAKQKDEFIILKDSSYPVRVVPRNTGIRSIEHERSAQRYFDHLVREVKASIDIGKSLDGRDEAGFSRRPSVLKNKQLYTRESFEDVTARVQDSPVYEIFLPYKKKSLTQPPKVIGMVSAKTPKEEYVVRYQPPYSYRPRTPRNGTVGRSFTIPLDLSFSFVESSGVNIKTHNPPDVRGVSVELVLCTYRSRKYPIPVEFTKNMQFQNKSATDSLGKYVIQPFSLYLSELRNLTERYSLDDLHLDRQTVMDIKALAKLSTKYNNFKVESVKSDVQGGWKPADEKGLKFTKRIGVSVSLDGLFNRDINKQSEDISSEAVCLVPTFQGCIVGRFYYLSLSVKLSNNDAINVKLPLRIQN